MFHRFSLTVLTILMLLTTFVGAAFPPCGESCIGVANPGSCSLTDNVCLCQNASYCNATNNCFRTSCSTADWRASYNYAVFLCNQAGVTQPNVINPPPPTKRAVAPEVKRTFVPVYAGSPARV